MKRETAKKKLLESLSVILDRDDELFPDLDDGSAEYKTWDSARKELVAEFERRSVLLPGDTKAGT